MDHSYSFSRATLDDWAELKAFWQGFKKSAFAARIDCTLEELQAFLIQSYSSNDVGIVLGRQDGELRGVAVLEVFNQRIANGNGQRERNCFINGVHVLPKTSMLFSEMMCDAMDYWGASRGCAAMTANVRLGYKFNAVYARYGYKPVHTTIHKPLTGAFSNGKRWRGSRSSTTNYASTSATDVDHDASGDDSARVQAGCGTSGYGSD